MRALAYFPFAHAFALVTLGCGTSVEYTETNAPAVSMSSREPEDVEVFTTQVPSDRPYQEVGQIEARQSSQYSVHGQTEIIAELRAQAAERGCHGIIIQGSSDEVRGSMSNGSGSVRTLKGYRATCILFTGETANSDRESSTVAAAGATAPDAPEAPSGVAGFEFAMGAEDARAACEGAAHSWSEVSKGAICSGPAAPLGVDGKVQLLPCNDAYCQILVTSEPAEGQLVKTTTALKSALEKRYGAPTDSTTAIPQACVDDIATCIDQQRAYLEYVWAFGGGQAIKLRLGKKPPGDGEASGSDHKLRLLYTRPVPVLENQVDDSELSL